MAVTESTTPGSEEEPKGGAIAAQPDLTKKLRPIFTVGRAVLTKEELESPGVLKMLVERCDDSEGEIGRLEPLERELFETRSELRVAKAELTQIKKDKIAFEIIAMALAMAGSAMLSAAKSLFAPELLFYGVGIAILLLVAAIVTKVIQLWPR
jgi:hypothetical protein